MIALILSSILVCVYALMEAADDFKQILNEEEINHKKQWLMRAAFVATYLLFCGDMWWIIGLAGLFSAVFRYALNGHRGVNTFYIAPWSNAYDKTAHALVVYAMSSREPRLPSDDWRERTKDGYFNGWSWAVAEVHSSGRVLYIAEITAFLGTVFIELFA